MYICLRCRKKYVIRSKNDRVLDSGVLGFWGCSSNMECGVARLNGEKWQFACLGSGQKRDFWRTALGGHNTRQLKKTLTHDQQDNRQANVNGTMKFNKVGRVAIITRGRYAGKKVSAHIESRGAHYPYMARSYGGTLTGITGCHNPTTRQWNQRPPISPCSGCRNWEIPIANHPKNVESPPDQAQQGQAVHQDHQLQPLDAYTLHTRAGRIEGSYYFGHVQGAFPERGCEEDCQEGIGGKIHVWQEQMVLHPT